MHFLLTKKIYISTNVDIFIYPFQLTLFIATSRPFQKPCSIEIQINSVLLAIYVRKHEEAYIK